MFQIKIRSDSHCLGASMQKRARSAFGMTVTDEDLRIVERTLLEHADITTVE